MWRREYLINDVWRGENISSTRPQKGKTETKDRTPCMQNEAARGAATRGAARISHLCRSRHDVARREYLIRVEADTTTDTTQKDEDRKP